MKIFYEDIIAESPGNVFAWIEDPEKAMKWQKTVKSGEIIKDEPEMVGTTFKEVIEENGKSVTMYGEITKFEKNKTIGFHIKSKIHKFDAFLLGALYFFGIGRHFAFRTPVNHRYIISPETLRHPGSIYGHVPTANDNDLVARVLCLSQVYIS